MKIENKTAELISILLGDGSLVFDEDQHRYIFSIT
jgi:hypothetical protein